MNRIEEDRDPSDGPTLGDITEAVRRTEWTCSCGAMMTLRHWCVWKFRDQNSVQAELVCPACDNKRTFSQETEDYAKLLDEWAQTIK